MDLVQIRKTALAVTGLGFLWKLRGNEIKNKWASEGEGVYKIKIAKERKDEGGVGGRGWMVLMIFRGLPARTKPFSCSFCWSSRGCKFLSLSVTPHVHPRLTLLRAERRGRSSAGIILNSHKGYIYLCEALSVRWENGETNQERITSSSIKETYKLSEGCYPL